MTIHVPCRPDRHRERPSSRRARSAVQARPARRNAEHLDVPRDLRRLPVAGERPRHRRHRDRRARRRLRNGRDGDLLQVHRATHADDHRRVGGRHEERQQLRRRGHRGGARHPGRRRELLLRHRPPGRNPRLLRPGHRPRHAGRCQGRLRGHVVELGRGRKPVGEGRCRSDAGGPRHGQRCRHGGVLRRRRQLVRRWRRHARRGSPCRMSERGRLRGHHEAQERPEKVWGTPGQPNGEGTGCGYSKFFAMPVWQKDGGAPVTRPPALAACSQTSAPTPTPIPAIRFSSTARK